MKLWKIAALLLAALSLFATACGAAEEAADTVKEGADSAVTAAGDAADDAKDAVKEAADTAGDAAKDAAEGAKDAAEGAADTAKEAVDTAVEAAKGEEKAEEAKEEEKTEEAPAAEGEAGQGGELLLLQWQGPSQANGYLSSGTKDRLASSIVLEPMAWIGPSGNVVPALAVEVPTVANGGISEDLTEVTWTLQEGLLFADGSPVTSEDVKFSWEYCVDEQTSCSSEAFDAVEDIELVDDRTVTIKFDKPQPYPYSVFVSAASPIISKAQYGECIGDASVSCSEQNFHPLGTGPYVVTELKPEDTVTYAMNPNYRGIPEGKPYFSTVVIKGGGDAEATARSVLEIGEADFAWNLQVAPEVMAPMMEAGKGRVQAGFGQRTEHINLNQTNNRDEENRSMYTDDGKGNHHPMFHGNADFQKALSIAIDRDELVAIGYGDGGRPTCTMWGIEGQASDTHDYCLIQDIDEANRILDEDLEWLDTDGDGVRELPDGTPLEFDYVTSTNAVRQSFQELIKDYWAQIGVKVNLRNEAAGLFFDGTSASDVSIWKFYADMEMYTNSSRTPDPATYMSSWKSTQIPTADNNWSGGNMPRMVNEEFDKILTELESMSPENPAYLDLVARAADIMSAEGGAIIPLVDRADVSAFANNIHGVGDLNGWDSQYWNIQDWYRED